MKKEIYTCYSENADITFIMEEKTSNNGELISLEVKGFYYGQPNKADTKLFYGDLKLRCK